MLLEYTVTLSTAKSAKIPILAEHLNAAKRLFLNKLCQGK